MSSAGSSITAPAAEAWRLLHKLLFRDGKPRFIGIAQEFDLAPQQAKFLVALEPDARVTMGVAARLMHCDNANATGVVDRLEARGIIERRSDPNDRRVKLIGLTEAGATLRTALKARWEEPPAELTALSEADQRTLRDVLARALAES